MRQIPFTQYLRPNGERREGGFVRSDRVADKADLIIEAGHRFEAEILTTGHVSLTIVGYNKNTDEEGDLAIKVVLNDRTIGTALDAMIMGFML